MTTFFRFLLGCLISIVLFVIFFFAQRLNYSVQGQAYFLGTKAGYFFIALFLVVVTFFLFAFIKHRDNHKWLRKGFIIFSIFYLLCGILVILSFDNYLQVTKEGIEYNPFFSVKETGVRSWREIDQTILSCNITRSDNKKPSVNLSFIVAFRGGPTIDLNSPNSPLYHSEEFRSIYNALLQHRVPIEVRTPLPKDLSQDYPLYAELCKK